MNIEALNTISYGLYLVCSGTNEKSSGYVSNTVFQVSSKPPQFAISCSKNNMTAELIAESKVFSISVLEKDTKPGLIGLFGFKSGHNTDKFSAVNHFTGETGVPVVTDNTIAWFECKLIQSMDVDTHILFIGEVINSELLNAEKEVLTYSYYREVKRGIAPPNAPTYIAKDKS